MTMTPEKWQRYIDNQCSEQEKKEIFLYLESLAPGMLEKELANGQWEEKTSSMPDAVARRMDNYLIAVMAAGRTGNRKTNRWYYWAAACSVGLAIGIFLWWNPANRHHQPVAARQYKTIPNTSSYVRKVTLPDSSEVWLTPHSVLQMPTDYAKGHRDIFLEGEAYFEVVRNPAHPFVVHAGGVQTTVLGTHFNIEAYSNEADTRVSLTNGKVAVKIAQDNGRDSTLFLTPGHRLVYQSGKKQFHTEPFGAVNESDWKNGGIVLNDLPVADALHRLEKRFGKTIQYAPGMFTGKRFTATYRKADLVLVLQNMAFVQGFRYKMTSDTVLIHSSK